MRAAAGQQPEPAQMLTLLNDTLQERKLESQYVTMLFALWDDESRTLTVANSGAVQPILCAGGKSATIHAEGFPLGLFPEVQYDEIKITAQPGDVIVFVSDGILDAENEKEEMYGEERLARMICSHRGEAALAIADAILEDVTRFQGAKDRFDDETIIVLQVR
jgi:sigma-B regulation protein RsbU (phosphoserine phosphatase)